ncbi:MazG-like pyrophosphatase [Pseudomonas phage Knedl]|nr:MazG-like pyrophosphatase [Pseudomonas phage Knedl]
MKDYMQQADVTMSPVYAGGQVDDYFLTSLLTNYVGLTDTLDSVKKALFYGKGDFVDHGSQTCEHWPQTLVANSQGAITRDQAVELVHGIIGVATEAGEMVAALLESFNNGKPLDLVNMVEETGDVMWYLAAILKNCNSTFEKAQQINIQKLRQRFGDKFSAYDALNRNLDAERKILEGSDGKVPLEDGVNHVNEGVIINNRGTDRLFYIKDGKTYLSSAVVSACKVTNTVKTLNSVYRVAQLDWVN